MRAGCRRTVPRLLAHACDVDADHKGDLMLTGGAGWSTIPVGFSRGDGTFWDSNDSVYAFPVWSQDPSAKVVSGDFNGDGKADLALLGGHDWYTAPVAFSTGNGNFNVTNYVIP